MTIPGVGPVTASAIVATVQDAGVFASGREFAAFLGLTPRQNSTGGKPRLGRITKMGDRYLRKLLVVGACATLRHRKGHNDALRLWASAMLERKTIKYKFKLTAVALANKVARKAEDMTAPETFTTASKRSLTKGRRPDMTAIYPNRPRLRFECKSTPAPRIGYVCPEFELHQRLQSLWSDSRAVVEGEGTRANRKHHGSAERRESGPDPRRPPGADRSAGAARLPRRRADPPRSGDPLRRY